MFIVSLNRERENDLANLGKIHFVKLNKISSEYDATISKQFRRFS